MKAQRFVTVILALWLASFLNHAFAGVITEDEIDFSTLATTSTLNATQLVVGEVVDVSFVFQQEVNGGTTGPLSIVKVSIATDMKEVIGSAENDDPDEDAEQFVSFSQVGGPLPNGDIIEAVGFPLLEVGDYVFLRLPSRRWAITNNGVTVNSCTEIYGTVYAVDKQGNDNVADHVITKAWRNLDLNVADMTRLVRAILRNPEEMRTLERDLNAPEEDARYEALMNKIEVIEKTLALPDLEHE